MKPQVQSRGRVPELDGIRGIAICLVLFDHFIHGAIPPETNRLGDFIKGNLTLGGTGVDLFFVLSGFLIGGILMDHRWAEHYFKSFYTRRVCRIFPLYYFLILTYAVLPFLLSGYSSRIWFNNLFVSEVPLWAYATFTHVIYDTLKHGTALTLSGWLGVTWSLAIEEQFYLIFPAVVRFARPAWLLRGCVVWIVLHAIFYLYLWMYQPGLYWHISLMIPFRINGLLLGVICACLTREARSSNWLSNHHNSLQLLLGVLFLGVFYIAPRYYAANYEIDRDIFYYFWMDLLYCCILLLAVTKKEGLVAGFVRFKPLCQVGIISFGVYLFHSPVNGLMHGWILQRDVQIKTFADGVVSAAALVMTLLLAATSWHFFEKPIIAWGHGFLYGRAKAGGAA